MFNLYRLQNRLKNNDFSFKSKNHLTSNLLFMKTNYLPKNIEYKLINSFPFEKLKPLAKIWSSTKIEPLAKIWSSTKIEPLANNEYSLVITDNPKNPDMITIFYMILGITIGSFIYYIKI